VSTECVLGHEVTNFISESDEDCSIVRFDELHFILWLDRRRHTEYLRSRLAKHEDVSRDLRRTFVPRAFLEVQNETRKVAFLVSAGAIICPAKTEDVSPDEWARDVNFIHQYLETRSDEDMEFLKDNGRELTVLFGASSSSEPEKLVLKAALLMMDLLRIAIENNWGSGEMVMSVTLACGRDARFLIGGLKATSIEMKGQAFDSQMELRKYVRPNTIVMDGEMNRRLRELRFGVEMEEIAEDVWAFVPCDEVVEE
jgi:hypothetical protein